MKKEENKMKTKKSDVEVLVSMIEDAPEITNEYPVPAEIKTPNEIKSEKLKEAWRLRKLDGTWIDSKLKYTEEVCTNQWIDILEWFELNEDALFIRKYFECPDNHPVVSYVGLKRHYGRYPVAELIRAELKELLRDRLIEGALNNKFNSTIAKLMLINNYKTDDGERYRERIENDITLKAIQTEYVFGNPELNTPKNNIELEDGNS